MECWAPLALGSHLPGGPILKIKFPISLPKISWLHVLMVLISNNVPWDAFGIQFLRCFSNRLLSVVNQLNWPRRKMQQRTQRNGKKAEFITSYVTYNIRLFPWTYLTGRFSVFVPDLRNHGLSPHHRSHTYFDMASDLRTLCIDRGIQDATFVAHSLGAGAAMLLCLLGDFISHEDGINWCSQKFRLSMYNDMHKRF